MENQNNINPIKMILATLITVGLFALVIYAKQQNDKQSSQQTAEIQTPAQQENNSPETATNDSSTQAADAQQTPPTTNDSNTDTQASTNNDSTASATSDSDNNNAAAPTDNSAAADEQQTPADIIDQSKIELTKSDIATITNEIHKIAPNGDYSKFITIEGKSNFIKDFVDTNLMSGTNALGFGDKENVGYEVHSGDLTNAGTNKAFTVAIKLLTHEECQQLLKENWENSIGKDCFKEIQSTQITSTQTAPDNKVDDENDGLYDLLIAFN